MQKHTVEVAHRQPSHFAAAQFPGGLSVPSGVRTRVMVDAASDPRMFPLPLRVTLLREVFDDLDLPLAGGLGHFDT